MGIFDADGTGGIHLDLVIPIGATPGPSRIEAAGTDGQGGEVLAEAVLTLVEITMPPTDNFGTPASGSSPASFGQLLVMLTALILLILGIRPPRRRTERR